VKEFDAWASGSGRMMAEVGIDPAEPYLLVSLGTGTSAMLVRPGSVSRVGGTALGGGTVVGLGAAGFYMYANMPDWALTTVPEIARKLSPDNRLYPNPKNMYIRILAEAGIFGFAFYLAYLFGLLGDALSFLRRPGLLRFLGIAGLCSWLAIVLYNITQDSFATPNIWVNLGILAGMTRLNSENTPEKNA